MDTGVMDEVIAAVGGDVVVVGDAVEVAAAAVVTRGRAGTLNDFLFFPFSTVELKCVREKIPRGGYVVDELLLLGKRWRVESSMAWRIWLCILKWNFGLSFTTGYSE